MIVRKFLRTHVYQYSVFAFSFVGYILKCLNWNRDNLLHFTFIYLYLTAQTDQGVREAVFTLESPLSRRMI